MNAKQLPSRIAWIIRRNSKERSVVYKEQVEKMGDPSLLEDLLSLPFKQTVEYSGFLVTRFETPA